MRMFEVQAVGERVAEQRMQVRLVYRRAPHHAAHSGYHLLARHVQGQEWRPGALFHVVKWLAERVLRLGPGAEERWYPRGFLYTDLAIALGNLVPRGVLFHFLDGEDLVRLCPRLPRWNNRVVATLHQPPRLIERLLPKKGFIAGLDAAVALSSEQARCLEGLVGKERVHFVPHGVDVEFWRPGGGRSTEPVFLTVGAWLRDLDRLAREVRALKAAHPEWRFRLVAPAAALERMEGVEGLERAGGLDDEQLREEYRRAWAVLLPLEDATANNALLEAMACGTPIVATRVGGVPDYADEDCACLVEPGQGPGLRQALEELVRAPARREAMGRAGSARARAFAWERVGARMDELYQRLLGGRP